MSVEDLANIEKLEVAESIPLQEAGAQSLEIVHGKWLDDAEGTPEDDTGQHACLRRCDADDNTNQGVQDHCESSCNENKCEGPA